MVKSQQTRIKQEKEKQKQKKKKDKAQKKLDRQAEGRDGSIDDMIAYVDEYGRITSTPPDPGKREKIKAEDIDISIRNSNVLREPDAPTTGVVSFFNDSKGYGFIRDALSGESLFVHINSVEGKINEGDQVIYDIVNSPKGKSAVNVKAIVKPAK